MKKLLSVLAVLVSLTGAQAASATCYVEYKAKQDNPLRLEQGMMVVPDSACTLQAAQPIVAMELAQRGWTLLSIVSVNYGS